jgi:DNA-directed RNA polymerase specialized sigma24 family protein
MLQERCAPRLLANPVYAGTQSSFASVRSRRAKHLSNQRGANERSKAELEQSRLRNSQGLSLDHAIRLAQGGDAAAFESIYRRHSRRVYALCLRLARDPVEAEDPTQEAFLQLFRKIHTFRGESAFSSWLYRLTANVAFMSFRKKKLAADSLESWRNRRRDPVDRPRNRRYRLAVERAVRSDQSASCHRPAARGLQGDVPPPRRAGLRAP